MEFLNALARWIQNLISGDEPLWQKLAVVASVLGGFVIAAVILESAMGLITIGRLERQVNLLKELSALSQLGVGDHVQTSKLNDIFKNSVNALSSYNPVDILPPISQFISASGETISKVLPGGLLWFLVAMLAPFLVKGSWIVKLAVFFMVLLFALAIGAVVALVINLSDPGLNSLVRFIVGIIIFGLIIRHSNRRNARRTDQEGADDSGDNV